MKKELFVTLSIAAFLFATSIVSAKTISNSTLTNMIKLYKSGNYTACYVAADSIISKDPSNAIAYYYKAMTAAQMGKKDEAIENYGKTISLSHSTSNIYRYAQKGKVCLEDPEKCHEPIVSSPLDGYIKTKAGIFSKSVQSDYERLKIQQMMRDINNEKEMDSSDFRDYRDFSSMNNSETPTNDEIVAALRTLQKAGLTNFASNSYSDLSSMLLGSDDSQDTYDIYNMSAKNGMDTRLMQALLKNNMSLGF